MSKEIITKVKCIFLTDKDDTVETFTLATKQKNKLGKIFISVAGKLLTLKRKLFGK